MVRAMVGGAKVSDQRPDLSQGNHPLAVGHLWALEAPEAVKYISYKYSISSFKLNCQPQLSMPNFIAERNSCVGKGIFLAAPHA